MAFSHSLGPDCFCSGRQLQEGLRKLLERSVMPAVRTLPMAAFSAPRHCSRSVPKAAGSLGKLPNILSVSTHFRDPSLPKRFYEQNTNSVGWARPRVATIPTNAGDAG